jgi:hypothetical protein
MYLILCLICLSSISSVAAQPRCDGHPLPGILDDKKGRAYALFVGVNAPSSELAALEHPANDAREMFRIFKNQCYQADTILNEKATYNAIVSYIDTCGKTARTGGHKLQDSDRILFYFSGHGSLNKISSSKENQISSGTGDVSRRPFEFYLHICREKGDSGVSMLRSSELLDRLVNTGAYQVIAIFDACDAGGQRPAIIPINTYYDRLTNDKGLFVLSSWERRTEEEVYTTAIKEGLVGWSNPSIDRNHDHAVNAFELIQYVNDQVGKKTNRYGEAYRANVIYIGGGAMSLTVKP